jgi:hypothetical protein
VPPTTTTMAGFILPSLEQFRYLRNLRKQQRREKTEEANANPFSSKIDGVALPESVNQPKSPPFHNNTNGNDDVNCDNEAFSVHREPAAIMREETPQLRNTVRADNDEHSISSQETTWSQPPPPPLRLRDAIVGGDNEKGKIGTDTHRTGPQHASNHTGSEKEKETSTDKPIIIHREEADIQSLSSGETDDTFVADDYSKTSKPIIARQPPKTTNPLKRKRRNLNVKEVPSASPLSTGTVSPIGSPLFQKKKKKPWFQSKKRPKLQQTKLFFS